MKIEVKLMTIQQKLNAPKNQYNKFGGYNYRSCEDILEALKPLLAETKTVLTITDDVVMIGTRVYVKATAILHDTESEETISNTALAREADTKKGMDESQITGSSSSYARKYSLNGLFCIDDVKDADTRDNRQEEKKPEVVQLIDRDTASALNDRCVRLNVNIPKLLDQFGVRAITDLTMEQVGKINGMLNKAEKEEAKK